MSLSSDEESIICFFFELYNRRECIFLLLNQNENSIQPFEGCKYIFPQKITDENLYVRAGSTVKLRKIKDARLLCIGLGAIGSQAAINLARLGFINFILIDKEILILGNIMRHEANIDHVGQNKVTAIKEIIGKVSPFSNCQELPYDILNDTCDLNNLKFDFVISSIADDRIETFINKKMISLGKVCIYGRTTDTAYACRIIRVIPRKDPCLKCLSYYSTFGDERYIHLAGEINKSNAHKYIKFQGCTSPSFIGVNLDIQLYANLLSRIFFENTGCGEEMFYTKREANHYIYSTRIVPSEPKISNVHCLIEQKILPLKGCPICGNKDLPYSAVVILRSVLDKIIIVSEKAKQVETGGVLMGAKCYLENDNKPSLIITHATLPGPNAIKEPAFFERDKDYCTEMVKYYFEFSDKKLNYVGEWHSHTSSDVKPSNLDHSSLQKIVLDKKYVVDFPVSIIQSASDKDVLDFGVYTESGYKNDNFIVSDGLNIPEELKKLIIEDLDPCPE